MICLLIDGEPTLLISGVRRDSDGKLNFGFVENGLWDFEIRKSEVLAKNDGYIVTRHPLPNYHEIEIPNKMKGDYNELMEWARREYKGV